MAQSRLFENIALSVTDLTRYLRQVFDADEILQRVWVSGEISNLSRPSSGHIYFSLKDSNASLRCVIWRSTAMRLTGDLRNGMAVDVQGAVSIYEREGNYQLYVNQVRTSGEESSTSNSSNCVTASSRKVYSAKIANARCRNDPLSLAS